jgi:hypothetical protein
MRFCLVSLEATLLCAEPFFDQTAIAKQLESERTSGVNDVPVKVQATGRLHSALIKQRALGHVHMLVRAARFYSSKKLTISHRSQPAGHPSVQLRVNLRDKRFNSSNLPVNRFPRVLLGLASIAVAVEHIPAQGNQPTRDPIAIATLVSARDAIGGSAISHRGFRIAGVVTPTNPAVPPISFSGLAFPDGYSLDSDGQSGPQHSVAKRGILIRSHDGKKKTEPVADLTPRIDYLPFHDLWQRFEDTSISVTTSASEAIEGEMCQHVHIHIPPPEVPKASGQSPLEEDLYVSTSTHLIRRLRYSLPDHGRVSRVGSIELTFTAFQNFAGIPIATIITRSINGMSASTTKLSDVSFASTNSIATIN